MTDVRTDERGGPVGSRSSAGAGKVGGKGVAGGAVQPAAGAVVAAGGAGFGVAESVLQVAEADAGIQTGRERCSNRANAWGGGGRVGRYSSGLVIGVGGDVGGVGGPVGCGVAGPAAGRLR